MDWITNGRHRRSASLLFAPKWHNPRPTRFHFYPAFSLFLSFIYTTPPFLLLNLHLFILPSFSSHPRREAAGYPAPDGRRPTALSPVPIEISHFIISFYSPFFHFQTFHVTSLLLWPEGPITPAR